MQIAVKFLLGATSVWPCGSLTIVVFCMFAVTHNLGFEDLVTAVAEPPDGNFTFSQPPPGG